MKDTTLNNLIEISMDRPAPEKFPFGQALKIGTAKCCAGYSAKTGLPILDTLNPAPKTAGQASPSSQPSASSPEALFIDIIDPSANWEKKDVGD